MTALVDGPCAPFVIPAQAGIHIESRLISAAVSESIGGSAVTVYIMASKRNGYTGVTGGLGTAYDGRR
jgi:hypothetical protein